jgi:uncharacterized membrane protein AbrB (regulator of aidB expression)
MQHKTVSLANRGVVLGILAGVILVVLCFGYGYFFGRYEQIQVNKSILKPIPDVNCAQRVN